MYNVRHGLKEGFTKCDMCLESVPLHPSVPLQYHERIVGVCDLPASISLLLLALSTESTSLRLFDFLGSRILAFRTEGACAITCPPPVSLRHLFKMIVFIHVCSGVSYG